MGLLSKIGKGIGKVFKPVADVLGGIGKVANLLRGVLNSPIGNILKLVFPQLRLADGALAFAGVLGGAASMIGGGLKY